MNTLVRFVLTIKTNKMKKILIVESEFFVSNVILKQLDNIGAEVRVASSLAESLNEIPIFKPDVVVLSHFLPDGKGVDLIPRIKLAKPLCQIVMLVNTQSVSVAIKAIKIGAYDYVDKQTDLDKIGVVVNNALEKLSLIQEISKMERFYKMNIEDHDFVGISEHIHQIRNSAQVVASNKMNVYIHGEIGTGKSSLAQYIHSRSEQSSMPFFTIDCRSLSDVEFQEILLGTVRTGTPEMRRKRGYLERVRYGTIYLDEVQCLSLKSQQMLKEVLLSKSFSPNGLTITSTLKARIISSSTSDLISKIENSSFDSRLFSLLNGINFELTPLRDRPEDIVCMANYFLKKFSLQLNKNITHISEKAIDKLTLHNWKANNNELEEVMKQAVLYESSNVLNSNHLNLKKKYNPNASGMDDEFNINKKLNEYKDLIVRDVLQVTKGNKTQAAKLLGVSRRQFYRYLD